MIQASPVILTPPYARLPQSSTEPVESVLWWVHRLANRLHVETVGFNERHADGVVVWREGMARLDRYYRGHFDLPFVRDADVAVEYLELLRRSKANFMRVVVDSAAERVRLDGLRLPGDDEVADEETWNIWQRNGMELWFPIAVETALVQRRSYLMVWWDDKGENVPRITVEDPKQVITESRPGDRTMTAAALKLWRDDWTGEQFANLYLPDEIHYLRWGPEFGRTGDIRWHPREESIGNRLGEVPVYPLVNHPGMDGIGVSRIEDVLPAQDRLNQTLLNMQVAEHLSAFRQKWATGLEIPMNEEGKPIEPFSAAVDKLWLSPDPTTKFGQFEATDMDNYGTPIEMTLEHISVITRTPRHAFVHQGQAPSGDAMKSDEAGLVSDVKGIWADFGVGIRSALAAARKVSGLETPIDSELLWADPEFQTFGQLVDGHVKLLPDGVASVNYVREKIGMKPSTIKRVEAEVMADGLLRASLGTEELTEVSPDAARNGAAASN